MIVFHSSDGEMAGLVLRKPEGLRDWYNLVQKQVSVTKSDTTTKEWHNCVVYQRVTGDGTTQC